ncbi:hypothetical protein [Mycolicibacter minnesotensis]
MSKSRWSNSQTVPSIVLSLTAAGLLVYHVFCDPTRKFDGWAVALLVIVFLPWLGSIFETIEFPGGGKVEWRKRVEDEQQRQASEIEGLQFLIVGLLTSDERVLLQQLANNEPVEMKNQDISKFNEQLRSLRRLTLIAQSPSFVKLLEDVTTSGTSVPIPDLVNEMFDVTDRGRKYLELSADLDLSDIEELSIGQPDGEKS